MEEADRLDMGRRRSGSASVSARYGFRHLAAYRAVAVVMLRCLLCEMYVPHENHELIGVHDDESEDADPST